MSIDCWYPERVVQKAVDDGVDEAVAHCQPVYCRVDDDEEVFLWDCLVVSQVRSEVDEKDERVQRQPTDGEQRHNDDQHLDHLCHLHVLSHQQQPNSVIFSHPMIHYIVNAIQQSCKPVPSPGKRRRGKDNTNEMWCQELDKMCWRWCGDVYDDDDDDNDNSLWPIGPHKVMTQKQSSEKFHWLVSTTDTFSNEI